MFKVPDPPEANTKCPAAALPGAAPNPASAPIIIEPAEIVEVPVYVFVPDKVSEPAPAFVSIAAVSPSLITPSISLVPLLVIAKVP